MAPNAKKMLGSMMLIREFEMRLAAQPNHGFQLLSSGEEAVAVGLCSALQLSDQLLTGGRSIGPTLARGLDPRIVMAELLGKSSGANRGKGGRGHISQPSSGFFGAHAVVGGNISIAAGVALARKLAGSQGIVTVMFGDGACGAGTLHETLNIAAIWRLPLLFVCNNNQLSVSTPVRAAIASNPISDLAVPYGLPSQTVDGTDLPAVAAAAIAFAGHVRSGAGPAFLECRSFRFAKHSTTARETRSRDELRSIWAHCPILKYSEALLASGDVDATALAEMKREAAETVADALIFAQASDYPDAKEALTDVY